MNKNKFLNFAKTNIRLLIISTIIGLVNLFFAIGRFVATIYLFSYSSQYVAAGILLVIIFLIAIPIFILNLIITLHHKIKMTENAIRINKIILYALYAFSLFLYIISSLLIATGGSFGQFVVGFITFLISNFIPIFLLYLGSILCIEWTNFEKEEIETITIEDVKDENNIG